VRTKIKEKRINLNLLGNKFKKRCVDFLSFLSDKDASGNISRSSFWAMIATISAIFLLIIAYVQLKEIKETTNAEFSHKIKNDLYTQKKIQLISLFDADVICFKYNSEGVVWFELDTALYSEMPTTDIYVKIPTKFNVFEIDELLQDFEDLSFYEKKGQISLEYIYDAYAYYIEMLWENVEIRKYINWQRNQPHNGNSYINLEGIYNRLKSKTDKEL
jgi:hypothetical protein